MRRYSATIAALMPGEKAPGSSTAVVFKVTWPPLALKNKTSPFSSIISAGKASTSVMAISLGSG
ncbi:MAG: hypothetical protein H7211_08120 [Aquabacterium sp.]|nr:hypothetical protein [Ferruginibacter sp.]